MVVKLRGACMARKVGWRIMFRMRGVGQCQLEKKLYGRFGRTVVDG